MARPGSTSAITVRAVTARLPEPTPEPKRALDPGGRLVDRGEIGRGGMGVVLRILDRHIGRFAALKLPHDHLRDSDELMQRFVREAQVLGRLDHPNIVPLYDLVLRDERDPVHFTMKLVRGQTLHERIADKKPAERTEDDLRELLQVLLKVCDAIAFAHGQGVVHRDLKPENVMIGSHGQVYVMDWGIAEVSGEQTGGQEDAPLGTPQYMAKEQARGETSRVGPRTDVFALGAILYSILTGRAPHRASSNAVAWLLAREGRIEPPSQIAPEASIPPRLEQIAMKALAPEPDDRYPSAEAFRADLERFLRSGLWFASRTFPKGTVIVREGDEGDLAFILVEGRCEAYHGESEGRRVLRTMGPGDVFGEMALLTSGKRTASVVAVDDVRAMVVRREALFRELGEDSWLGLLVRTIATRFRELEERHRER